MCEKTKKTKKIIYWITTIVIAVATTIIGLLETSCCPELLHNFTDGYDYWYNKVFKVTADGDTIYYTNKKA